MGREGRKGRRGGKGRSRRPFPACPPAACPPLLPLSCAPLRSCSTPALGLAAHRSLHTNAFDLSVFDYALWSTATGGPVAYVPMFRHSLFAQHFMPTLLAAVAARPAVRRTGLADRAAGALPCVGGVPALPLRAAPRLERRGAGPDRRVPVLAARAWRRDQRLLHRERRAAAHLRRAPRAGVAAPDRLLGPGRARARLQGRRRVVFRGVRHRRRGRRARSPDRHRHDRCSPSSGSPRRSASRSRSGAGCTSWIRRIRSSKDDTAALAEAAGRLVSMETLSRIVTVMSATGFACLLAPAWAAIALPGHAGQPGGRPRVAAGGAARPLLVADPAVALRRGGDRRRPTGT